MFMRGRDLFEISRRNDALPAAATTMPDTQTLSHFFISEEWSGDLSSGVIKLGEHASFMHGLPQGECGLLSLIRCYDRGHHDRVLEIFEQASAAPSRFCFSTGLFTLPAMRQPLICMGDPRVSRSASKGAFRGSSCFRVSRICASPPSAFPVKLRSGFMSGNFFKTNG